MLAIMALKLVLHEYVVWSLYGFLRYPALSVICINPGNSVAWFPILFLLLGDVKAAARAVCLLQWWLLRSSNLKNAYTLKWCLLGGVVTGASSSIFVQHGVLLFVVSIAANAISPAINTSSRTGVLAGNMGLFAEELRDYDQFSSTRTSICFGFVAEIYSLCLFASLLYSHVR